VTHPIEAQEFLLYGCSGFLLGKKPHIKKQAAFSYYIISIQMHSPSLIQLIFLEVKIIFSFLKEYKISSGFQRSKSLFMF
jgi:hypothetical protein